MYNSVDCCSSRVKGRYQWYLTFEDWDGQNCPLGFKSVGSQAKRGQPRKRSPVRLLETYAE
jgi:hypothetical protein